MTEFELWHNKKNNTVDTPLENERIKWGKRLEAAIASGIAEENAWAIQPFPEYMCDPSLKIGASFDFSILSSRGEREGILEIKNVDGLVYKNTWIENEDGSVEAPLHIELQVQHQLLVSGLNYAYIGALIGGNRLVVTRRERNEKVLDAIKTKVIAFWQSVNANQAPAPDFSKDAEYIVRSMQYADPGKVLDGTDNAELASIAEEYRAQGEIEKAASSKKAELKARLLTLVGDAEKVLGNGFTVSLGMVGPADVAYRRDGYRGFRISWKKTK
jgi:predicted phage-related endonuclease